MLTVSYTRIVLVTWSRPLSPAISVQLISKMCSEAKNHKTITKTLYFGV